MRALDGSVSEDVKILAAHEIVSMAQAKSEVSQTLASPALDDSYGWCPCLATLALKTLNN